MWQPDVIGPIAAAVFNKMFEARFARRRKRRLTEKPARIERRRERVRRLGVWVGRRLETRANIIDAARKRRRARAEEYYAGRE